MLHEVNLGMIFQGLQMRNHFGWHLQTRCQIFFTCVASRCAWPRAMLCGKSRWISMICR